jgi:hypothetical protein
MELASEFVLTSDRADYLYNINFHTHPLLIGRDGDMDQYRLSTSDVDYVQMIVDGDVVSTLRNTYREDPVINRNQIGGVYTIKPEFFQGDPIVTKLLDNDPTMRVVFWRQPRAPYWITYKTANGISSTAQASVWTPTPTWTRRSGGWQRSPLGRGYYVPGVWEPRVRSFDGQVYIYRRGTLST